MLRNHRRLLGLCSGAVLGVLGASVPASALVITPTFTSAFVSNFGTNATAAENAWIAAAAVFTNNLSDPIHVNITVDGVAGTSVFGESSTNYTSVPYSTLYAKFVADAKSTTDATAVGASGSVTATDPITASHYWWVSTAESKALGISSDNLTNDGTTTFGAGNPFTFSGTITSGTYDFQGVAAHEISEVLGRSGLSGGTIGTYANSYSAIDLFSFTGAGARGLTAGANENFSVDNGTTLLKTYNNALVNSLDTRDWAPATNDSFNQYANPGVTNPVTAVDLQELDAIGYDSVPEPSAAVTAAFMLGGLLIARRPRRTVSA